MKTDWAPTLEGTFVRGDSLQIMQTIPADSFDCVIMDPPYEHTRLINEAIGNALRISTGATLCFMYPEDLVHLDHEPQQVVHWVKPVSTKNTTRKYSRFVESICVWHGDFFNQRMHWSNRTGIFTDTLDLKNRHPFEKPAALIRKLLLLHNRPDGKVLDPFAGSMTVRNVARDLNLPSTSIEVDPGWWLR